MVLELGPIGTETETGRAMIGGQGMRMRTFLTIGKRFCWVSRNRRVGFICTMSLLCLAQGFFLA